MAKLITDVSGASEVFGMGLVTYANEAKMKLLGVPSAMLEEHGAVSEPVARAMAEGVREVSGSELGIGITGVAGPTGGTPEKPVGLIYIALSDGHADVGPEDDASRPGSWPRLASGSRRGHCA